MAPLSSFWRTEVATLFLYPPNPSRSNLLCHYMLSLSPSSGKEGVLNGFRPTSSYELHLLFVPGLQGRTAPHRCVDLESSGRARECSLTHDVSPISTI